MNDETRCSPRADRRVWPAVRFGLAGALGLSFLLLACSSPPETRYYDIRLPDPSPNAGLSLGCIIVDEVAVPDHLAGPEIFYRSSAYEAGYYGYHLWVRPLSASLSSEIVAYLGKTDRFENVVGPREALHVRGVRLSVAVEEFAEIDGGGDVWRADVHVAVRLEDESAGRRSDLTIRRSAPIAPRNAVGTVAALNKAWAEVVEAVLDEIVSFIKE